MEGLVPALLEYGMPGIIITALGWAYWQERKRNHEIQDKRIEEGRESLQALSDNTRALESLTDIIKAKQA